MRQLGVLLAVALLATACGGNTDRETTTTEATPSTAPTTTTAASTTTTLPPEPSLVAETPIVGVLEPYNAAGGLLFPSGSVEAHWYQWEGSYVVLYRGFDAASGAPICAGNSMTVRERGFTNTSNAPHNGTAEEICASALRIAEPPAGVFACGSLLYYVTEIPFEDPGTTSFLNGTLEVNMGVDATTWEGQTSQTEPDMEATPEFEPNLRAYELPSSNVDDGGVVTCG